MDSSTEVSKLGFSFHIRFELKNAVRLKVWCVWMVYCSDGGHVLVVYLSHLSLCFLSSSFGYYCFSFFESMNNEEKLRICIFNIFESGNSCRLRSSDSYASNCLYGYYVRLVQLC